MTQPPYDPTAPQTRPLHRQPWVPLAAGLAGVAVLGAVIGGGSPDPSETSADAGTPTAAAPTSAAPSPSAEPAPSSAPLTTSPTSPAPIASAPLTTAPSSAPAVPQVDFAMPDVVGMDLQSAQNVIQTFGVYLSVSHDLRGSRNQVLDSNWIVCDQNVPPGQRVTGDVEGAIDLGVVKREESCP